ncbi:hypothetical protein D3C85_1088410 [compost metagenome]
MPPNLPFNEAEIAPADRLGSLRSSNGRKPMKAIPAFGLLVKPLIDRPGNATALSKPGSFMAMVLMRRITDSVRSRLAASGNCAKVTRYFLSWVGTKPVGVVLKPM